MGLRVTGRQRSSGAPLGVGGGVGGTQCHEVGSNQGGLPGGSEMGAQRVVSQVRGRPTL